MQGFVWWCDNSTEELHDLGQFPVVPCKGGTVFSSEGMVLDFVTAYFIESYFTTQPLKDETIQIAVILLFDSVMVKFHMPIKILRNVQILIWPLSMLSWNNSGVGFERLTDHSLFNSYILISWHWSGHQPLSHLCPTEGESRIRWPEVLKFKEILDIHHKWGILQLENFKCNLVQLPTQMWTRTVFRRWFTVHFFFRGGCFTSIITIS